MRHLPIAIFAICATAFTAAAQDVEKSLGLELNSVTPTDAGCRLTFLTENNLAVDLTSAVFETVLFTRNGVVDRLTLFDMQAIPSGRPRVRQFDVPDLVCSDLGQVLINGVHACTGEGVDASSCERALKLFSKVKDVEVLG